MIDGEVSGEEEEEITDYDVMKSREKDTVPLLITSAEIPDVYDSLLQKVGFTLRLFFIVLSSGLGLLSDTLEIMSISFAKEYIAAQFSLSRQEESVLSGVLFAGMLLGGLFWGRSADMFGRRTVLIISLSMNGISAAVSSAAPNFWVFLLARFFSGVGVGGSLPIIFSYVSEWSSSKVKGALISTVATCWMVGSVIAAGLAWAILPEHGVEGAFWQPWRSYLLLCSLPSLIAVVLYMILDESPAFLMEVGKKEAAIAVLRKYTQHSPDAQADFFVLKRLIEDTSPVIQNARLGEIVCEFGSGILGLFGRQLYKTTLILISVILPVHFGYYGFMLWFPEYLKHQSESEGTIRPPSYIYIESFYVSLSALPPNIFTVFLTDRIGPKRILSASLILSAGSVFLLWRINGPDMTVILSCLFNGVTTPVFNMVDVVIPGLYPAESRGTAFGFHTALIRVVSILATWVFSLFIDSAPAVPILMTAVLLLSSAVVSIKLPNMPYTQ